MSIKSIIFFLTCLFLLSSVTSPVRACPPPDCGDCKEWDPVQEECVWKEGAECEDSLDCKTCYYCMPNCKCELPYGSECGEDDPCPGECHTCVGAEICLCEDDDSKCNAANCETCIDGVCKVCGGDTSLKCCPDGSCVKPCELEPTSHCDTSYSEDCPGCDADGLCPNNTTSVYTGNDSYSCIELGCEGDCVREDVHCYTTYDCALFIIYDSQYCFAWIPNNWRCVVRFPENPMLKCHSCHQDPDDPGEPFMIYSKTCVQ